jgi:hypothetical protein
MVAPAPKQPALDPADRPTPSAAPALPYERGAVVVVSVRGFRLFLALTLLNTALLASMAVGPQLFTSVGQVWQQWKDARAESSRVRDVQAGLQACRTFSAPASTVVYEEDPDRALKLVTGASAAYETVAHAPSTSDAPPGWVAPVKARSPEAYGRFMEAVQGKQASTGREVAVLFLHERTAPSGTRYVVAVVFDMDTDFNRSKVDGPGKGAEVTFHQYKQRYVAALRRPVGAAPTPGNQSGTEDISRLTLGLPDGATRPVASVRVGAPLEEMKPIDYGNRLRLFAGQPDVADASHFTIAYELDGRPGVIDGWLRDDGIDLRPREGERVYTANGPVWKLTPPTATRPATGPSGPAGAR